MVIVGSAEGLKRVFQTNQRNYVKDLDFSFHPFLPILGTGLVTAQGKLWQQQRLLMAPTLRVDVLDDVVSISFYILFILPQPGLRPLKSSLLATMLLVPWGCVLVKGGSYVRLLLYGVKVFNTPKVRA